MSELLHLFLKINSCGFVSSKCIKNEHGAILKREESPTLPDLSEKDDITLLEIKLIFVD